MPLPAFVGYRIIWFIYILTWLVAALIAETPADRDGARWLIFLTNQAYIVLVVGTGPITILTVGYAIVHFVDKHKLQRFHQQSDAATTPRAVFKQDNIAWYMKICWLLYVIGATMAIIVLVGFWGFVYNPVCESPLQQNSTTVCIPTVIDVYSVHFHLINAVLIILDLYFSRIPYQLFHIFYPSIYTFTFVIFSLIYFAVGGTNPDDEQPYIYEVLDYGNNTVFAAGIAVVLVIAPTAGFVFLFLLAWIRDAIYKRICIPWCYRDLQNQTISNTESSQENVVV